MKNANPQDACNIDKHWMSIAINEANLAAAKGEVPVGAVLVATNAESLAKEQYGIELSRAHNTREADCDPTAHAEILVLRQAEHASKSWRRYDTTLYVTLEPCPMCVGAAMLARITRIAYGASDPVMGATGSVYDIAHDTRLPHTMTVTGGMYAEECSMLLKDFFARNRTRKNEQGEMSELAEGARLEIV